jgi:transcriptional regulator with XRE-family HTH domain
MLPVMAAPTRAKRRLGEFLTTLRTAAGKSAVDAAGELKTSDSTVNRYESGHVLPVWSSTVNLLRLYNASDEDIVKAAGLWEEAKDQPKPVRLPAGTPPSFRRLVNAEREAEWIKTIEPYLIPGLLQTEQYARALVAAAHRFNDPSTKVEGVIATRLSRQQTLVGQHPLRLHAIIDEAVIGRNVGGSSVMREQLTHLLSLGERPTITIQVMSLSAGAYGTMSGACTIVGYPGGQESGVYLEYPAGGAWVDDAEDVQRFTAMFEDATDAALAWADTADLIYRQIRAMDQL